MPKIGRPMGQVGGKPEVRDVVTAKGSPLVEDHEPKIDQVELVDKVDAVDMAAVDRVEPLQESGSTPLAEAPEPALEQAKTEQSTVPPSEEDKIRKTWGTVMVFSRYLIHRGDPFPFPLAHDQEVEFWVPQATSFTSMNEAERYIKEAAEADEIPAGRYVIARKVKGIKCTVEQIRRVETVEED